MTEKQMAYYEGLLTEMIAGLNRRMVNTDPAFNITKEVAAQFATEVEQIIRREFAVKTFLDARGSIHEMARIQAVTQTGKRFSDWEIIYEIENSLYAEAAEKTGVEWLAGKPSRPGMIRRSP
uniref:Uncharacterized protein n=1 Tax=viral metagenome TaxID=1070528 RepID=A0A6M3LVS4_9ZZZZ